MAELNYPCFGKSINTGVIVCFTSIGAGLVVKEGDNGMDPVGRFNTYWDPDSFEECDCPFNYSDKGAI